MALPPRPWPLPAVLAVTTLLGVGCSTRTATPEKVQPAASEPGAAVAEPGAPAAEAGAAEPEAGAVAEAKTPPPLTEEDLALIATDPKDLTPEMRRKRAYARRRQIMQNPDSPTARALNDLVEAHQAGDIDIDGGKKEGVWFSLPGSKPTSGRPPAGWRPSDGDAAQAKPAQAEPAREDAATATATATATAPGQGQGQGQGRP